MRSQASPRPPVRVDLSFLVSSCFCSGASSRSHHRRQSPEKPFSPVASVANRSQRETRTPKAAGPGLGDRPVTPASCSAGPVANPTPPPPPACSSIQWGGRSDPRAHRPAPMTNGPNVLQGGCRSSVSCARDARGREPRGGRIDGGPQPRETGGPACHPRPKVPRTHPSLRLGQPFAHPSLLRGGTPTPKPLKNSENQRKSRGKPMGGGERRRKGRVAW